MLEGARASGRDEDVPAGARRARPDRDLPDPLVRGPAEISTSSGSCSGRADRARRRRAAHLGDGGGGHAPSFGQYLAAVCQHQAIARMLACWFEAGHDLLLTPTMGELPPPLGELRRRPRGPAEYDPPRREDGGVHRAVQRDRPTGDLAAAAVERGRAADRRAADRASRSRGRAAPRRRAARAGAPVGGPVPGDLLGTLRLMPEIGGVITAMVTPFAEDRSVDEAAARCARPSSDRERLARAGARGHDGGVADARRRGEALAAAGGSRRAGPGRPADLRHRLQRHPPLRAALARPRPTPGADAVLAVTPYYNKPNFAGIKAHYEAVAKAAGIPVVLYNIPSRVVVNLSPEQLAELAQIENIVAVKQANDDELAADRRASGSSPATTGPSCARSRWGSPEASWSPPTWRAARCGRSTTRSGG